MIILAQFACFCPLLENRITLSILLSYLFPEQNVHVWGYWAKRRYLEQRFVYPYAVASTGMREMQIAMMEWEARIPTPITFTFKSYRLVGTHTKRAPSLISAWPMTDTDEYLKYLFLNMKNNMVKFFSYWKLNLGNYRSLIHLLILRLRRAIFFFFS